MVLMPLGLGLVIGGSGGCSCRPVLDPPATNPDDGGTTYPYETSVTGDTGPEPPCAVPEVEDNNAVGTATALPLERRGCGFIDAIGDLDYWSFTLEDEAWLTIDVSAADGSIADMNFLLTPEVGAWAAARPDGPETLDASLTFPAPPGAYNLAVSEQQAGGGDRFGYDILVTEDKPPAEWDRPEVEPNDDLPNAEPLDAAVLLQGPYVLFGRIDDPEDDNLLTDTDWFLVTTPPGRHDLHFDIDAYDVGSSADLTIRLWNDDLESLPLGCEEFCPANDPLCVACEFKGGLAGLELDPFGKLTAEVSQNVYIQVQFPSGFDGPSNWYTLALELEAL